MADKIDKALPNVDPEVNIQPEEITVTETDKLSTVNPEGTEVVMDEEGGAEINFDPMAQQQMSQNHFDNLAEQIDDHELGKLRSKLFDDYSQYKFTRKDWEDTYT